MKKAREETKHRHTEERRTDKMSRSGNSARDLDEAKEKAGSRAEGLAWLRASVAWEPRVETSRGRWAKGTGSHQSTHASLEPTSHSRLIKGLCTQRLSHKISMEKLLGDPCTSPGLSFSSWKQ